MTFNELMALDEQKVAKPKTAKPSVKTKPKAAPSPSKKTPKKPAPKPEVLPSSRLVERLRKAVKALGKEASTHRFTAKEKAQLADIIYTYSRQGYRTSENEVVRIAINWLLRDYRQRGKASVLHQVLRALKA